MKKITKEAANANLKKEIKKLKAEKARADIANVLDIINPLNDTKDTLHTSMKLLTSALTLVASLAWNEAIKIFIDSTVKKWLPEAGEIVGKFIYAVIVTLIVVFIVNRIKKINPEEDKK